MGFKIPFYVKFLKLGLTELTSASGRCSRIRTVYASLVFRTLRLKVVSYKMQMENQEAVGTLDESGVGIVLLFF